MNRKNSRSGVMRRRSKQGASFIFLLPWLANTRAFEPSQAFNIYADFIGTETHTPGWLAGVQFAMQSDSKSGI